MELELVERARRGDTEAFRDLVEVVGPRLYGIAARILRDRDLAEDALQQALIAVWRGLPGLRDPSRFDAWVYRLAVNASYREARRGRRLPALVREIGSDAGPAGRIDGVADRDEIEQTFRHLTPEHRAVLVLHYYAGLTIERMAEVLDVSPGTVASRLHHACRSFRAAFDADARASVEWRSAT